VPGRMCKRTHDPDQRRFLCASHGQRSAMWFGVTREPSVLCRQECLTRESVIEVLKSCEAGKPLPMKTWGSLPMNGQESCEGPQGQTTLLGEIPGPKCRDLPEEKVCCSWRVRTRTNAHSTRVSFPQVDPASVKTHMMY